MGQIIIYDVNDILNFHRNIDEKEMKTTNNKSFIIIVKVCVINH